jgi:simple sugar transport system ATP-binding protein
MGLREILTGSVRLAGTDLRVRSTKDILNSGVGNIPEDRSVDGLVVDFTVAENLVLDSYWAPPYSGPLNLQRDVIASTAEQRVKDFDIRTPSIFNPVGHLSGGNQQKVIAAREFTRPEVKLVIASQPTRGLDVGSIEYIHRRIVEQRDAGAAVLIVSSELDEVISLADTIAVMYQGKIVGTLAAAEATLEELGLLMGGAHPEEASAEELQAAVAASRSGTDG